MRAASGSMRARPASAERQASSAVPERHAEVAHDRGVGQVALPARHRQLLGEVPQHRVRESGVALGILEGDGVHLVRHGRRSDLAGDRLLREVAERDVTPGIAAEVDEDRVRPRERVAVGRDPVVRLDLRRVLIHREPEPLDEPARLAAPVVRRVRGDMRVEAADRAIELPEDLDARGKIPPRARGAP